MEHTRIETNGIALHVVQEGPDSGTLVILLHGFPDFWYGWRRQMNALAEAGYRVWAPDQRGYNLSDKPEGIAAYRMEALAADILGLIDAAGVEKATIIGHDWGAAVGWWLAQRHRERLSRLVAINVPHGAVMSRHLRRSPRQILKSWYIFFFQIPWLPEALARLGRWWAPSRALQNSSLPGTFTGEELALYRQAWSEPGAFRSMIHWYRAAVRSRTPAAGGGRIRVPTLLLWGARDRFLDRAMARPSIDLCAEGKLEIFEGATHWVHLEKPEEVNGHILSFLQEGD